MKIKKLSIHNFSSHPNTIIAMERPITMIVGTLGTGKSSLLQSIEYALTGDCGFYRKKTDNRMDLVHDHSSDDSGLSVELHVGDHQIRRTRSAIAETFTWDSQALPNAAALSQAIIAGLKAYPSAIAAILNVSNFFELDAMTQKELIIALIGADVTHEKVAALFTGEPEALKMLQCKITSLQAIKNAHQYAFDRRTVVKRELKELRPPSPPDGPEPPIDKIRLLLTQLETELQTKIASHARFEGIAQASDLEGLRTERSRLISIMDVGRPADEKRQSFVRMLENAKKQQGDIAELINNMEHRSHQSAAEVISRQKNIALLQNFNGKCVAGDHACPASKEDMDRALVQQQTVLHKAVKDAKAFQDERQALIQKHDDRTAIQEAEKAIREFDEAVGKYDQFEKQVRAIDVQLTKVGAILVDRGEMDALASAITVLRERLSNGRQQLEKANSWLERERQVKAVAEKRATLERELTYMESLVEFFGPKGVKVQLIDERIGSFTDLINKHLEKYFGFTVKIEVEPWRILGLGRPITRLSRSERFRLGIAFQIALAKLTGLNFVVCDDAELLTPDARSQMMGMLLSAELDQAIVIMTLMDRDEFMAVRPKFPPSIEVFMVEKQNGGSEVQAV